MKKKKFSLLELLIIIAIVVVLAVVFVITVNPAEMMVKSRDAQRYNDLRELATAVSLYLADNHDFKGLTLPSYLSNNILDAGRAIDGIGWIPLNFKLITSGSPFSVLPLDPLNNDTYHYTFAVDPQKKTYEINCVLEFTENLTKAAADGGNNINVYEVGTDLTLIP